MLDLVNSQKEVNRNIVTLCSYKEGTRKEREFHDGIIKRGRLFVVGKHGGGYAFAPSRFAGYQRSDMSSHAPGNLTDGRLTNVALTKIFGKALDEQSDQIDIYNAINSAFFDYCKLHHIVPSDLPNPRKYWLMSDAHTLLNEEVGDDAIDDIGAESPITQGYTGVKYYRDPMVRNRVLSRARGVCEYCGQPGFARENGSFYLECHHIIALADDGADRMTNVIALCPNHHREAHFGLKRGALELEMIEKVKKRNKRGG